MACCWMWRKGMAIWWHHYHAMAFVVGISSGQRQLSPWARKGSLIMGDQMMQDRGNFQNRVRDGMYCHTFSTELVFADRLPSSSTGVVHSMLIFTNIPVRKLECVFLYFECFFIARSPHLPIVLWRKKERLRQWRMFWLNFNQGLTQLWKNTAFCVDSCQKRPSRVTSSNVSLKEVLTHMWDGIHYDIIGLSFRDCWGWRFCAFQSHYSSGKQDSINVQSECSYFTL